MDPRLYPGFPYYPTADEWSIRPISNRHQHRHELMSSNTDTDDLTVEQIDQKLEIVGEALPEERVEALQKKRAELAGEGTDDSPDYDITAERLEETLDQFEQATFRSRVAIENEIAQRREKLNIVGDALPEDRVATIQEEIEALEAAADARNRHLPNTPEALAERAEVRE
jgi:uncharacterized protein YydD (DUF2326 family)